MWRKKDQKPDLNPRKYSFWNICTCPADLLCTESLGYISLIKVWQLNTASTLSFSPGNVFKIINKLFQKWEPISITELFALFCNFSAVEPLLFTAYCTREEVTYTKIFQTAISATWTVFCKLLLQEFLTKDVLKAFFRAVTARQHFLWWTTVWFCVWVANKNRCEC